MAVQAGARVRSIKDGQLGYVVETEDARGGLAVRLDRKHETRLVPFNTRDWLPDERPRLTAMQIARVAYESDRALRSVTGEYGIPDWVSLKEPLRLAWLKGLQVEANATDESVVIRTALYRGILKVLAQ